MVGARVFRSKGTSELHGYADDSDGGGSDGERPFFSKPLFEGPKVRLVLDHGDGR